MRALRVDMLLALVAVSFAGLCYCVERVAPGSIFFTVPLCVGALVLMDGRV